MGQVPLGEVTRTDEHLHELIEGAHVGCEGEECTQRDAPHQQLLFGEVGQVVEERLDDHAGGKLPPKTLPKVDQGQDAVEPW